MFSVIINYFNPDFGEEIVSLTKFSLLKLLRFSSLHNEYILVDGSGVINKSIRDFCDNHGITYAPGCALENMAKSYNKGIKLSKFKYVVLLANDIIVCNGWDYNLQKRLNTIDSRVILQPYLTVSDHPQQIFDYNIVKSNLALSSGMTFNLNCISKDIFEEVGLLDESMSGYFNDTDYFIRALAKGIDTIMVDIGSITHLGKSTTSFVTSTRFSADEEVFRRKYNLPVDEAILKVAKGRLKVIVFFRSRLKHIYKLLSRLEVLLLRYG